MVAMADIRTDDGRVAGEAAVVRMLAPLTLGAAGALDLADDCALIAPGPGCELVLKTDPVAEGVHFLAGDAPEDVAWKALAVNVSDLAAKAARPVAYLLALSFPEAPAEAWLRRFVAGLGEAQASFGCHLLGGDTDRRPGPVTVCVTIMGEVERGRMVRRGTAQPGDVLFVSGTLGDAALGLRLAKDGALAEAWGLAPAEAQHLRRRYARPQPRLALAGALRAHASAAMDISDGLAKDLGRMATASRCAMRIRLAALPLSAAAAKAVAADPAARELTVAAGDDYEVLAAVPPHRAAAYAADALAAGVAVAPVGEAAAGSGILIEGPDGAPLPLARTGWDHF